MSKKDFYSKLFKKHISELDENYWAYVKAETLYRIDDMLEKECSCMACKKKLSELREYYLKIKIK
jgi:hypothetical protein